MEESKNITMIANSQYGIRTPLPENPVLAMAYVPYQQQGKMYCPEQGIVNGTLYPDLNKPFLGCKER